MSSHDNLNVRSFVAMLRTGFGLLGLCWSLAVSAATVVSGSITNDTVWQKSQSPYQITADLTIDSGATLTVEAGTVIYFDANTNLIVNSGALVARGTSADPILFTSQLESTSAAVPGNWGQIRFFNGTNDAVTILEHATIRYGNGVVIQGAAPTLNNTVISDNIGPAVSIDLTAEPAGQGNQAFNNDINGIAVPAGVITGSAVWKLKGIPYVVADGELSVGAAPTITGVTPNQIEQGQTTTATITGSRLSGAERVSLSSAQLTATIAGSGTDTAIPVTIVAASTASQTTVDVDVQVAAGKARIDGAVTVILPQPKLNAISPSAVYANRHYPALSILGANFNATSVVTLNGAELPTTFVDSTTLTANVAAQTAGEKVLRVRSVDPTTSGSYFFSNAFSFIVLTPSLSITPTASTIRVGTAQSYRVSMPFAADAGGLSIDVISGVPSVATTTSPILIPEGATSVTTSVNGIAAGSTTITASHVGFNSAQTALTVIPPPSITLNPTGATISKGKSLNIQLTISEAAPVGGLTISLSSSNAAVVSVPASVSIAGGAQTAQFTADALTLGSVTITATSGG